jgi:hypothetical protein
MSDLVPEPVASILPPPPVDRLVQVGELVLKAVVALVVGAAWLIYGKIDSEFAVFTLLGLSGIQLAGRSRAVKGLGYTAVAALFAAGVATSGCASLPPLGSVERVEYDAKVLRDATALVCFALGKQEDPACLNAPLVIRAAESFVKAGLVK